MPGYRGRGGLSRKARVWVLAEPYFPAKTAKSKTSSKWVPQKQDLGQKTKKQNWSSLWEPPKEALERERECVCVSVVGGGEGIIQLGENTAQWASKILPKSQAVVDFCWNGRFQTSLVRGWVSACQCRGHRFNPWSGKIPHALGQLSLWATTTEALCHSYWSLCT